MKFFLRKNKRDKLVVKLMLSGIFLGLLIIGKLISSNQLTFGEIEISITLAFVLLFYHTTNYFWTIGLLICFYLLVPFVSGKGYVSIIIWAEFIGFLQYLIFFNIYVLALKLLKFDRISLNFIISIIISIFGTLILIWLFNILLGYPVYYKLLGFTKNVSVIKTESLFKSTFQSKIVGGLGYYEGVFLYTLIINSVKEITSAAITLLVILSVVQKDKISR